jgi:saccharopine dehydrogenase (NAD+, L-lysine-forming)
MGTTDVRIVILGGYGYAGRALVPLLLQETSANLVIAGRSLDKAQNAAREWNERFAGGRVAGVRADAADGESLRVAFTAADLVVVASSSVAYAATVARTAVEAGIDYFDIQYAAQKLPVLRALAEDIRRAGRCFVTEAGFHPGLPSALVRYAAARIERLERAVVASVLNQRGGIVYSGGADELVESFRDYKAMVYRDGAWRVLSAWNPYRRIQFEGGFGARRCVPLPLEEMRSLPETMPGLRETGFYVSGLNWFADWVVSPLVMALLWLLPRSGAKPAGRLLCWSSRFFLRPPFGIALQVQAEGLEGGAARALTVLLTHEDGYAFTAIPVVACLLQVLDGSRRSPGLHLMGHLVEPVRLLADMRRMGIRIEEHESA